jgi:hypothetical protein
MSFFQLPLWLKGLSSSTGTDKLLAVKDNGEVTKSNKTLDEIGLTPSLQDVLAEGNTAITEGNWQFGTNRSRVTSNTGIYVQNSNLQANYKKNGIVFRNISTNDSIEINFAGSTGTHAQVLQDKGGTIALTSDIPVTSNFVPYTGATANVDLGSRQLTTTGNITGGASYSSGLFPSVNLNRTSDSKNLTIVQDAAQTKNHVTLTAPSDKNGTIALISDIPVIRTMNSATAQSTASLNSAFPTSVVGNTVVNINNAQRYTYTKISSSLWRQSALMTDI